MLSNAVKPNQSARFIMSRRRIKDSIDIVTSMKALCSANMVNALLIRTNVFLNGRRFRSSSIEVKALGCS